MKVIKIEGDQLQELISALSLLGMYEPYEMRFAIDEDGFKFKVNNGAWSPALGKEEST